MEQYSTISLNLLKEWIRIAHSHGVSSEHYTTPKIKVVANNSQSGYQFGVIFNSNRKNRPGLNKNEVDNECALCIKLKDSSDFLLPDLKTSNFIFFPNLFPTIRGMSLAISSGIDSKEKPMYTTNNLDSLNDDFHELIKISESLGLKLFHNSPGFGASLPRHEHWHLVDFGYAYDIAGKVYGFDAAEKNNLKRVSEIRIMPTFPFAHLIFNKNDSERIVHFLKRLDNGLGSNYNGFGVPHTLSQGMNGILVTVGKKYTERGKGSGDVAGHYVVTNSKDFESTNYETCISSLQDILFTQDELNIKKFL